MHKTCLDAITRFKSFLVESKPRQFLNSSEKTWIVFTDACYCYEPTSIDLKCGLGGIIYMTP